MQPLCRYAATPLKGRPLVHGTGFYLFKRLNEPPFRGAEMRKIKNK
jgi:hypothetical protein